MTRKNVQLIRKAVKRTGADCRVTTVGTGRHVDALLVGPDARKFAASLTNNGFTVSTLGCMDDELMVRG